MTRTSSAAFRQGAMAAHDIAAQYAASRRADVWVRGQSGNAAVDAHLKEDAAREVAGLIRDMALSHDAPGKPALRSLESARRAVEDADRDHAAAVAEVQRTYERARDARRRLEQAEADALDARIADLEAP